MNRAKIRRGLSIAAVALACLLLVAAGAALWLLNTESGLRFAVARATGYLQEGVELGEVQGSASGPLVVEDVRVATEGFTLEVDRVELQWQMAGLFGRDLRVARLYADGVRYTAREAPPPPPEEKSEPFELPERIELPVDVFLEDVRARDISLQTAPGGNPLVVHSVQLEAQWTDRLLDLEGLAVEAPLADIRVELELVPRGDYPLDAGLAYTVRPPDLAPVTGTTRIGGSLEALDISQSLASPYNLRAHATVQDVLRELRFEAVAGVTEVPLARIGEGLPAAVISARLNARGGLDAIRVDLTASAREAEFGSVDVAFIGEASPEAIAIERLLVDLANGRVEADGRVELTGSRPLVDVAAQWTALQWPLTGAPQVASEGGRLDVSGTLKEYRARLTAALSLPNQADGSVVLEGTGSDERFAFSAIEIDTLEGTVNGTAEVAWAPALAGQVDLQGSGLNPGGLLADWPGAIDFRIRGAGRLPDSGVVATLETLHARGSLRGEPLELEAQGAFANDALALETLALRLGSTQVEADGRIGEQQLALDWSLASDDLSILLPVAGGSVTGRGSASGTLAKPRVKAELSGSALRYEDYNVASLDLAADVDTSGTSPSDLELELREATLPGIEIETLSLQGSGTRQAHTLSLAASTSAGRLDLSVDGGIDPESTWAFVVERLEYAHPKLEPWSLRSPARGRLSAETAAVERLCLTSGTALVCIEGERTPERLQAAFDLEDLPLSIANPFLSPVARLDGSIGGTGSLRLAQGPTAAPAGPVVRVDLETTPIRLLVEDSAGEVKPALSFAPGAIMLDVSGRDAARLALDLPLQGGGGLEARASIAAGASALAERPLEGRFSAHLPDIGFIKDFTPQVAELAGRVEGDLGVSGTLAAPVLDGSLELLDGMAFLAEPQIRLAEVRVAIRGQGAGDLEIAAQARSGEGLLRIEGNAGTGEAGPHAALAIEGENFRIVNTPEATVEVSPELDVNLADNRLDVTGTVRVPAAHIELTEAPASAVGVSNDQVIVEPDAEEAAAAEALAVAAEVRVILGAPGDAGQVDLANEIGEMDITDEPVFFSGFGLTAGLAGDLTVIERPGEPTTATGEINVTEGTYTAYGQDLVIERGQVLFAGGPIDEPGLDVRAVRRPAEDILVGVEVRGTLAQPEFAIFSEPPMSETEQLSYLVLGRPLEGGSASESSALARAALALGIKGGNFLTDQFGDQLGVDQIGIETAPGESNTQAALVVGKYLSPKLYVSYGIGLLEPVSTLKLSYALSSKWRLVTESSSVQSGGDLFYSIER